jgi:fibronectin-binding autotransporter adhesin
MRLLKFFAALFAALALSAAQSAFAATLVWDGGAGTANWSDANNWSPNATPAAGDTLRFNSAVTSNANLGSTAIGAIVFGTSAGGSRVNGAVTINAAAPGINIDDQSTSGLEVEINATVALTAISATTLFVKSGGVGRTLYFLQPISGGHSIRIYGPGAVEFAMATNNTYTGTTAVASADSNGGAGTLLLSGFATVLVPGDLVIGFGTGAANTAQVKLTALFSNLIRDTSKVSVASDGKFDMGILTETIAQLSGTGNVTMSGSNILTVGDTGNFTFGGVISGTGNVNKVGTGAMTYTGANTYTGTTTVSGGTLVLGAPSATIFGPLNIGLGVGTTTTATVRLANNYQIDNNVQPITINADGKLDTDVFTEDLGAVTMNGGQFALAGLVRIFGGLTMNGGTISDTGVGALLMQSNVVATSTVPFGAASINAKVNLFNSSTTFTVNSGSTQPELTINGVLTIDPGFPSNLIKTGAGTLRLTGSTANDYGGSTTIAQGTLELAKPDNVGAISGPIVIGNGTDPAGSATLRNLASSQLTTDPAMLINASGQYDLNGSVGVERVDRVSGLSGSGSVVLPNRSRLQIYSQGGTNTFDGLISSPNGETTATNIDKRESGTQVFTANNTYTGVTRVSGGTLVINGQQTGAVSVNSASFSGSGRVGAVTLPSGAILEPGAPGMGGTLSTGPVNLDAAFAILKINLISPTVFGKLNVTGTVALANNGLSPLPAPGFVAPVGTVFEIVTNDGADPVVGTFGGLPQGATVSAGSTRFTLSYTGGSGNDITLTVNKNTLDIDGDGTYNPATDGLLISRYLNNLTGPALTNGGVAPAAPSGTATRTNATDILNYLTVIRSTLNVKGSGTPDSTDSLLILRYLFGFRGTALVAGVTLPGGETATTVAARIAALTP